jgi:hypothetical protein
MLLLVVAIALGWVGTTDAGKTPGLPITDNHM